MKEFIKRLVTFYNTNSKFHSFVVAVEYAAVSFLTSWSGGVPTGRSGWVALAGAFGGSLIGAAKRWLATNVATVGVEVK